MQYNANSGYPEPLRHQRSLLCGTHCVVSRAITTTDNDCAYLCRKCECDLQNLCRQISLIDGNYYLFYASVAGGRHPDSILYCIISKTVIDSFIVPIRHSKFANFRSLHFSALPFTLSATLFRVESGNVSSKWQRLYCRMTYNTRLNGCVASATTKYKILMQLFPVHKVQNCELNYSIIRS